MWVKRSISTLILLFLSCTPALSDKGLIFVRLAPGSDTGDSGPVKFFEPNQNAIIAFDGDEEILYLSTNLRAERSAKVLEVLPLPSQPKVTEGDIKTLHDTVAVLNSKFEHDASGDDGSSSRGMFAKALHKNLPAPAAVIVKHEQLGAHDVNVVEVLDPARFVKWTEANLTKLGSTSPSVPEWMMAKIGDYTARGFHWFAFDVVDLSPKPTTISPLRYRFATKKLFYPLQITKVSGPSAVKLIVLTSHPVRSIDPIIGAKINKVTQSFPLHKAELEQIDPEMNKLLDKIPSFDRPHIQMWELNNPSGKDYPSDLVARF
jgi:Uncharacterized protein conserved in bacteria (DUF2330)